VLLTTLDPEACRERLRERTLNRYSLRIWIPGLSRAVLVGWIEPRSFSVRRRSGYRKRPQMAARGHWFGTPNGTRVALDLTLDGPGRCFMLLAYLFVLPLALSALAAGLGVGASGDEPPGAALGALLFAATSLAVPVLAIVGIRRWLERTDGEFLVGYVSELLEARPDEATAAAPARQSE
jgi:hypothetical protein